MPKNALEHAGMVIMLVYLYKYGDKGVNFNTLLSNVKIAIESLRKNIEIAKNMGLLTETRMKVLPFECCIMLTDRGKLVAEHLQKVLAALELENG